VYSADNSIDDKAQKEMNKAKQAMEDLPETVKKSIDDKCPAADLKGVKKETYKGETAYEITCQKDNKPVYILIDKSGNVVREESTKYKQNEQQNGEK
jgi:uncharacterized protein with von Willebrand factor type A (vWA) domain